MRSPRCGRGGEHRRCTYTDQAREADRERHAHLEDLPVQSHLSLLSIGLPDEGSDSAMEAGLSAVENWLRRVYGRSVVVEGGGMEFLVLGPLEVRNGRRRFGSAPPSSARCSASCSCTRTRPSRPPASSTSSGESSHRRPPRTRPGVRARAADEARRRRARDPGARLQAQGRAPLARPPGVRAVDRGARRAPGRARDRAPQAGARALARAPLADVALEGRSATRWRVSPSFA